LRDIAIVAEYLPEQLLGQAGYWLVVIDIARSDTELQDFSTLVDHQVQFEANELTHRGLSTSCQPCKDLVRMDTLVEIGIELSGIDE